MIEIPIVPMGKPRMTQRDRWKNRPVVLRYHSYCDELRLRWGSRNVPERLALRFIIPMPPSWSNKKRVLYEGKPHKARPDVDNLAKAFMDALCENDSYIYALKAEKYWGETGVIQVEEY